MIKVIQYLQSKPLTDELLLLVGKRDSIALIKNLLRLQSWKHVSIYAPMCQIESEICQEIKQLQNDAQYNIPDTVSLKDYAELMHGNVHANQCTVVFDYITSIELLNPLIELSPQYLVGFCVDSDINSFEIWEKGRLLVKNMYFISYAKSEKAEELLWENDETYAVELSVIFPMYCVAEYLPQCIESCIAWDATYVEYLFVDDGSPDDCAEIVLKYAKKDARIKLLRKQNGGCASARQWGLEHAKGRYIGFVDPDDYIDPQMFRKLFMRALKGNYEIAYCGYYCYFEDSGEIVETLEPLGAPYEEGTDDAALINKLFTRLNPVIWRKIHKAELLDRAQIHFYTDLKMADDLPFHIETLSRAKSVVSVPECLYYYRLERLGQDAQIDDERLFVHFAIFRHLDEFFKRSSDRQQLAELQLKKQDTHLYVLRKIQKKYFAEYCKHAKADIRKNYKLWDGVRAIWQCGLKRKVIIYLTLYVGNRTMIRGLMFAMSMWGYIRKHL